MSVWEGDMRALFAITIVAAASISGAWSAMAQYGPARNPNPYGYYGYNEYSGYHARPRYAPNYSYYCQTPYYVLGYPVPHYGYKGWCFWR